MTLSTVRRVPVRCVLAAAIVPLALAVGCGPSLASMADEAMGRCIDARNPGFTAGDGIAAVATPLPPRVQALGARMNYLRAYQIYRDIADMAPDQVTLTCALELAAYYKNAEAQRFIARYTKHPDAAVVAVATRLTAGTAAAP